MVLASGSYKASSNGLLVTLPTSSTAPITYSALGVLVEMARAAGVQVGYVPKTEFALPEPVAQWAEIDALPWMKLDHPSGIFNLAYINTLGGGSFELEAAAIHDNL